MKRRTKLVAAGVVALALVGAGAALAAGGHAPGRSSARTAAATHGGGPLQAAATYLDIPVDTLRSDLRAGKTLAQEAQAKGKTVDGLVQAMLADLTSRLDAAVKAGKLTQTQEDTIVAMATKGVTAMVNGTKPNGATPKVGSKPSAVPFGPWGFGHGFGFGFGLARGLGSGLQAAADYLNIPVETLISDLRSGKTLAQEAQAKGKTADGLVQALVSNATSQVNAAVKSGKLTQTQADAITAKLHDWISDLVNGTKPKLSSAPRGHGGSFHRGWGFRASVGFNA